MLLLELFSGGSVQDVAPIYQHEGEMDSTNNSLTWVNKCKQEQIPAEDDFMIAKTY